MAKNKEQVLVQSDIERYNEFYTKLGYLKTASGKFYKPRGSWKLTNNEFTQNSGIGETVQGMSYSITELLSRHANGMSIESNSKDGYSTDDIDSMDLTKFGHLDFTEQAEQTRIIQENIKRLEREKDQFNAKLKHDREEREKLRVSQERELIKQEILKESQQQK